jgi:hypothetical protein
MKKIEIIYQSNKALIDAKLIANHYRATLKDFIQAVKDLGEPFLYEIYSAISEHWEYADGNGWAKFKNIFGEITGVVGKVNQGTNIANSFLNPVTQETTKTESEPEKKKWTPNIWIWGGIGVAIIIILLIIYLFRH